MEKNNSIKLLELLKKNQLAKKQYQLLGVEISDVNLSKWFILYSEQKENFVKQLILELEKLNIPIPPEPYPFTFNKNKTIKRKSFATKRLVEATKGEEIKTINLYNEVIVEANLPDSIALTLMRQKDQISLALRYLEKIGV